jgi:hypothetical protein
MAAKLKVLKWKTNGKKSGLRWDKFGEKWNIPMEMRASLRASAIKHNRATRRTMRNMARTFRKAFSLDILKVLAWSDGEYPYILPDKFVFRVMLGKKI